MNDDIKIMGYTLDEIIEVETNARIALNRVGYGDTRHSFLEICWLHSGQRLMLMLCTSWYRRFDKLNY